VFWSPPEDDLDDHHELSLVKLLSFRPIGLSLALGYLFQESPHDFSPFRTSVTSQAALHEMRENWLLMIWPGPWNPWKCHSSPDQRNANSQHPWPWLTDSSCKKREVATRDMMPMKNYASKILQMFTTELTPISVEYWVMTLHRTGAFGFCHDPKVSDPHELWKKLRYTPKWQFYTGNFMINHQLFGHPISISDKPRYFVDVVQFNSRSRSCCCLPFPPAKTSHLSKCRSANTKQNLRSVNLSMKKIHENWEIHGKYVDFQNVNPGLVNDNKLLGCLIWVGTM
jgi:hypothetical protein